MYFNQQPIMRKRIIRDKMKIKCTLDNGTITNNGNVLECNLCNQHYPMVNVEEKQVPDLRCLDVSSEIVLNFTLPQSPMSIDNIDRYGKATNAKFKCMSREKLRKLYGTKLQKEVLYYIDILLKEVGTDAIILDLGCGNGGNKKYLESLGFHNIISVDYWIQLKQDGITMSSGAEYLVDVHRLPFFEETFDLILTTATIEHFHNPFIAFEEMSRVLKPQGMLIASVSFWEAWHGDSCFHLTPGGIESVCKSSGLKLTDLWSGWGFIPSISTHAFGLGRIKIITYQIQKLFDFILTFLKGSNFSKKQKFRTSGAFGLFAKK